MKVKEKEKEKLTNAPSPTPEKVLYDTRIKRKNVLALNEKVAAIREYEKNPVYKRIGRMFHCSPDQIKRIVQQKDGILKAWEQRTRRCQDAKSLQMKVVRVSMLGKAVYDWIRRMMYYKDFQISDGLIQKMALQFKSAMGLQNFFPHQDWCDKFRQTYKITENDSKLLKISYTQGYSVQIKDIMKDVLSECTPDVANGESGEDEQNENQQEEASYSKSTNTVSEKDSSNKKATTTCGTATATVPANQVSVRSMSQLRQMVALPIQTNMGLTQKVLVATPITTATGQRISAGSAPMTMTIIPLATIGKPPANNVQMAAKTPSAAAPTSSTTTGPTVTTTTFTTSEKQSMPPPMIEIKQEPNDEVMDVEIKKEYISDEEETMSDANDKQNALYAKQTTKRPSKSKTTHNEPSRKLGAESMDSDDNLTLSSLRKIMQTHGTSKEIELYKKPIVPTGPKAAAVPILDGNTFVKIAVPPKSMPPLPPLTKAPVNIINRTANKRKHSTTLDMPTMTAIKTCGEARKYLKLLEDFALYKENFRLIGLITRADEVLRELDGDDDVDID